MSKIASIKFNMDHYSPTKPSENIFILDNKVCQCRELVLCADLSDLIIGQSYTITYSTLNNTALFDPQVQIIRAADNNQRFSTIAYIDPSKIHIVKAEISGINILASQMCVVKCGNLSGCEIPEGSNILLSSKNNWEYKFDDFLIFKFIPVNTADNISLTIPTIPEIASPANLRISNIPLINSSADIQLSNVKVGTLIYLSRFDSKTISVSKNSQNYSGTITPGVFSIV
jgi:hypothetical protein